MNLAGALVRTPVTAVPGCSSSIQAISAATSASEVTLLAGIGQQV
jgi:hypothetical protein